MGRWIGVTAPGGKGGGTALTLGEAGDGWGRAETGGGGGRTDWRVPKGGGPVDVGVEKGGGEDGVVAGVFDVVVVVGSWGGRDGIVLKTGGVDRDIGDSGGLLKKLGDMLVSRPGLI